MTPTITGENDFCHANYDVIHEQNDNLKKRKSLKREL